MRCALIAAVSIAVSLPISGAAVAGQGGGGGGPGGGGGGGGGGPSAPTYSDPPAGGAVSVEWYDVSSIPGGIKQFDDVDWSSPTGTGTLESFPYSTSDDPFWADGPTDEFAIRATGTLTFPDDGTYTLTGVIKDGMRLTIDGVVVLEKDNLGSADVEQDVTLSAGDYPFELLFFAFQGVHELDMQWEGPGVTTGTIPPAGYSGGITPTPGAGVLSADFFHGQTSAVTVSDVDWTVDPSFSENAEDVAWAYGSDPMHDGAPGDLALRVRGMIDVPESGDWDFSLGSDDSAMLLINGQVVINDAAMHAWGESTRSIWLPAGEHRFQLFYLDRSGDHGLTLGWQGPSDGAVSSIPPASFGPWRDARVSAWGETGYDRTMIARLKAAAVENGLVELGSDAYNAMNSMGDALAVFGASKLEDVAEYVQVADVPDPE